MIRVYKNPIAGIPLTAQEAICAPHILRADTPVYTDTAQSFPKERLAILNSLRGGREDQVLVSDLAVLATNRKDLREIRALLKAKGASVIEGRTGRISTKSDDFADMIQDAVDRWSHRGRYWSNKAAAVRDASKGGKALAKKRAAGRLPENRARPIWFNKRITKPEHARQRINEKSDQLGYTIEWSLSRLYDKFGPRRI